MWWFIGALLLFSGIAIAMYTIPQHIQERNERKRIIEAFDKEVEQLRKDLSEHKLDYLFTEDDIKRIMDKIIDDLTKAP